MTLFRQEAFFSYFFGLVPQYIWSRGFIWQPLTYMFIHGGLGHIFWNMFILWMFGVEIENYWGKKEFMKYYLITGIGSGLLTMLFSLNSTIPVVGASGAIYAVLLAFAMMFPNRQIYLYFLIPIPAKYMVLGMGLITFFSTFNAGGSNISHLTHLGGLILGFIYLKRHEIKRRLNFSLPRFNFKNPFRHLVRWIPRTSDASTNKDQYDTDETLREQVDIILDKINAKGYDSLTKQEQQTLFLASQYFAKKHRRN